jgi:TatD DNase family protein
MLEGPSYIDIHTHSDHFDADTRSVRNTIAGKETPPSNGRYYTVGMHPWYLEPRYLAEHAAIFKQQSEHHHCIGIGEFGLDLLCNTPIRLQEEVFMMHVARSEELQKPIILHIVRAFQEVLRLRQISAPTQPWIIHGFRKNQEVATRLLDRGFYLSFGSHVLHPTDPLIAVIQTMPIDRLFLETDNASVPISEIYRAVAEIRRMELNLLQKQMELNWNQTFGHRI